MYLSIPVYITSTIAYKLVPDSGVGPNRLKIACPHDSFHHPKSCERDGQSKVWKLNAVTLQQGDIAYSWQEYRRQPTLQIWFS